MSYCSKCGSVIKRVEVKAVPPPLSYEARMSRKPLPPEALAGALQDRVHKEVRRARGLARGAVQCINKDVGSIGI
jgi:hypothetical protein